MEQSILWIQSPIFNGEKLGENQRVMQTGLFVTRDLCMGDLRLL
jgi:hypothetical protein